MKSIPRLLRSNAMGDYGDSVFRNRRELEHDRASNADAKKRVDQVLAAEHYDDSQVAELASRKRYAVVTRILKREAKLDEPIWVVMLEPAAPRVAAYRAARAFDAIPYFDESQPFTLADLRMLESEEAACALASLGEVDWSKATRRVRCVAVLSALIGSRRS